MHGQPHIRMEQSATSKTQKPTRKSTTECINPLTPNDPYRGRTAPVTSKCSILHIYSTKINTEALHILNLVYNLRFFSSKCSLFHNSNVFGSCIIHILYTSVLKLKKIISAPKV